MEVMTSQDQSVGASLSETVIYDWSIEIIPKHLDKFIDIFSKGWQSKPTRVYITHLEDSNYQQIVDCAVKIQRLGIKAVPHLAARNLSANIDATQIKTKLLAAGVSEILMLGGNSKTPRGSFTQVLDLLNTREFDSSFDCLHFAGFPEPHPNIKDEEQMFNILKAKVDWAQEQGVQARIVTQFCFDYKSIIRFIEKLGEFDINAPVYIGICAPVSFVKLISFSLACGVGNSISFLEKQSSATKGLLDKVINRYNPQELIEQLEATAVPLDGLHYFPFGNYAEAFTSRQDG